jgi:hypothetical protein
VLDLGLGQRRSGRRMLVQYDADRIHGGTQDLSGALDRVSALADELMQVNDINEG